MRFRTVGFALPALLIGASLAAASPITFTETVIASGSLGSSSFTNSLVTLTATGDTSNVFAKGPGWFWLEGVPISISVASLGTTASLTDVGVVGSCQPNSCPSSSSALGAFGDVTQDRDILDTLSSAFNNYSLTTSIGPVTGTNLINPSTDFNTSKGVFEITSAGNPTFTAAVGSATPEPSAVALFGLGLGAGLAFLKSRR